MAQITLFTGENAFRLREERQRWKENFAEKHGDQNLLVIPAQQVTFRTLLDDAAVAPFLGDKRLIVIDGIPRFEKEEVEALPTTIHPDTLLLFCEAKPDKRLGGVKALLKVAELKEFGPPSDVTLQSWMRERAARGGGSLTTDAITELLRIAGADQDTLAGEIDKLTMYADGKPVDGTMVRVLAVPSGEQEVWQLTGYLAQGKVTEALAYARSLQSGGEDPYSLWSVLLWMLRSLVAVHAAAPDGRGNPAAIASSAGVPFPTVKNLLPLASRATEEGLRRAVSWAAQADVDLKTGGYKATGEAPQELQALIDRLILLCGAVTA